MLFRITLYLLFKLVMLKIASVNVFRLLKVVMKGLTIKNIVMFISTFVVLLNFNLEYRFHLPTMHFNHNQFHYHDFKSNYIILIIIYDALNNIVATKDL